MEPDYIAKRITELRLKKGVAEHRMSLELGHSRSYMQSISSGRALPSLTEFLAICEYLDVLPRDFFDEANPSPALINEITEKSKNLSDSDLMIILTMVNRLQS
ncbi:helix-turn-helix domain-containing protein [Lacrimispora sp.]|uniref:helix-turn-helix domain-containing protein n=1 Tax=Lacrimispora sp. TaxID=2719234 RepID=UPI0034603267